MPKIEAVYYPNFEPPSIWFRSFLLFFDKIRTIVPEDAGFNPSQDILEIVDLLPDVFEIVSPKERDIALDDLNLERMRTAFRMIKEKESKSERKKLEVILDKYRRIHIPGYAFLHNKKMSDNVHSLLEEFDLIKPEFNDLAKSIGARNYSIVNELASDLIVSQVADRIARLYGWNTVTDHKLDFAVTALNAFRQKSFGDPQNMLACSIINCEIPQEIQHVNPKKYREIRDAYSDIREPFHHVITQLSNLYRLEIIEDTQVLKERITEITHEFDLEVQKFKKSNFGRTVKRWMPIGVGGLASLTAAAIDEATVAITSASISVVIQIVQELTNIREPLTKRSEVHRLIANMQKDILKASEIRRLV